MTTVRLTALYRTTLALTVSLGITSAALSQSRFDAPDSTFKGRVSVVETPLVVPGTSVKLAGTNFKPGQLVNIQYGTAMLNASPAEVAADGTFRVEFKVPDSAAAGRYPLVVSADRPGAALIYSLKVSPKLALSGESRFDVKASKLAPGLYQAAYSDKSDRVFVTAATGRPPIRQSEILKVNPNTLAIEARVTPVDAPTPSTPPGPPGTATSGGNSGNVARDPGVYAVYGVGVDDVNGTVWVTNTRQNTVAVYRQSDLKLLKQFEPGLVPHARDVAVDERQGKVYASPFGKPELAVFDAKSLAFVRNIPIASGVSPRAEGAREFDPMSLALDKDNHRLYTVSLGTNEAAIINTRTDQVEKVFALENAQSASGVAYDATTNRLLVAAQGTDNLLIIDAASGKTLHDIKVGAGPLNVAFDPVSRLAYVPSRASGNVTVVDIDGKIVGNLAGGTFPNHATVDGKGGAFLINKSRGNDDPDGDQIRYVKLRR